MLAADGGRSGHCLRSTRSTRTVSERSSCRSVERRRSVHLRSVAVPGPARTGGAERMNRRRPQAAAIFDLDRTLIAGPSGPAFAAHLGAAGIHQRSLPGADLVAATYQALGETAITAPTARLAARATAGWPVDAVRAAAEAAADELMEKVQPYAPGVIDEHREAGRVLVMATTSPAPLVTPFAERLGFDAVVATQWAQEDGAYTGGVDGPLVWGRGKLEAVRAWAAGRGHRPEVVVRLQRQLLRRPAARRRRPPHRRQRRPPARRPGPPEGLAAAPLRPPRGRAQDRRAGAAGVDPPAAATGAAGQRPPRHRRRREHPDDRAR